MVCDDCGHENVDPQPDEEGDYVCENCGAILYSEVRLTTILLEKILHWLFCLCRGCVGTGGKTKTNDFYVCFCFLRCRRPRQQQQQYRLLLPFALG